MNDETHPQGDNPSERDPSPEPRGPLPAGVPSHFGTYEVLEFLGEGGFGRVFRGRDTHLGRSVAIKVPKEPPQDEKRRAFLREARAIAEIHHPNVCPVYSVGVQDGLPYIAMRYTPRTLKDLIEHAPPSPELALQYAEQLANGLEAIHKRGIFHRDLKPANVLYDATERKLLLTDFGIAYWDDATNSFGNLVAGAAPYMAPEQWEPGGTFGNISAKTDIYSLGVILFEFFTGRRLFNCAVSDLKRHHQFHAPRRPSELRTTLDRRLDELCLKALAKQQGERYGSAREFAEAIRKCTQVSPPAAPVINLINQAVISVIAPDGNPRGVVAPLDMRVDDFIRELIPALQLVRTDVAGYPLIWALCSAPGGTELLPNRTLEQNGVRPEQQLQLISLQLVRPLTVNANEVRIQLTDPSGAPHNIATAHDMRADEFIRQLTPALRLANTDTEGNRLVWLLWDETSNRFLEPNQSFKQNGIQHGHRLDVVSRTVTNSAETNSPSI
ncbi:MAG TPA: protein kinase [Gemmata sp.]